MALSFDIPDLCVSDVLSEMQSMDPYINYGQDYIDSKIAEAEAAAIKAGENVAKAASNALSEATAFADQLTGAAERVQTEFENRLGAASGMMSQMMKLGISGAAGGISSDSLSKAMTLVSEVMSGQIPSIPGISLPTGLPNFPTDFDSLKLC